MTNKKNCCQEEMKIFFIKERIKNKRIINILHIPTLISRPFLSNNCFFGEEKDENNNTKIEIDKLQNNYNNNKITTIFFFHGVGGNSLLWLPQIIPFSRLFFNIISIDFFGHGESGKSNDPRDFHFNQLADDVRFIFKKFKNFFNIIIGHSYGTCFSILLAHEFNKDISLLVLIGSSGLGPHVPHPGPFSLPPFFIRLFHPIIKSMFYKKSFNKKPAKTICTLTSVSASSLVIRNILKGQEWKDGNGVYVSNITCPTLCIHGDQDKLVDPQVAYEFKGLIKDFELHFLKDAGHTAMLENWRETNELIFKFINKNIDKINKK